MFTVFCYVASVNQTLLNSTDNLICWRVYQPVLFMKKKMHLVFQRTGTVGQSVIFSAGPEFDFQVWVKVLGCLLFTYGQPVGPRSGQMVRKILVSFVPESPLPFAQISSIYQKMATKTWNWYQKWLWGNGTQISVWNIPSRKTGLVTNIFPDVLLLPEIFRWSDPNRRAPFRISRKLSVNGQQPLFQILFLSV